MRGVLGKVLQSGSGDGWGGLVFVISLFLERESTGHRGNAVARSFSLSISLESQDLCPSEFPIKKNLF